MIGIPKGMNKSGVRKTTEDITDVHGWKLPKGQRFFVLEMKLERPSGFPINIAVDNGLDNDTMFPVTAINEYDFDNLTINDEKEDKTHTAGDIVYDNPLYDGDSTTADEYNNKWLNENKYNEIKELITNLEWEMDRMSSSGRSTLADLWKIFKIDGR